MTLQAFFSQCENVGRFCRDLERPLVVHHYDADGLSSGAATIWALRRLGRETAHITQKQLTEEAIDNTATIAEQKNCDGIVFVDFGSGYLSLLEKRLQNFRVAIIDHHEADKPIEECSLKNVIQANAHDWGEAEYDNASAASTAYLSFRQFGFYDLAELAIAGAVGDMQDRGGLKGANAEIVKEAEEKGYCNRAVDLRFFGKVSRPLTSFLSFCEEPLIPGISGNERKAAQFLLDNGFELSRGEGVEKKWLHYCDLNEDEKKRFASALLNHCLANGVPSDLVEEMVGEVYYFPKRPQKTELAEAYEFATLLNACGRHDNVEAGLSVCMNEEGSYERARLLLSQHRTLIRHGLLLARKKAVDLGSFYFFDGRGEVSDTVLGTVANAIRGSAVFKEDKPFVAFSTNEKGDLKVSSRGSKHLIERGLNLKEVMKNAAEGIGVGGGHNIAAGANLKPGSESEFLKRCSKLIAEQLKTAN